MKNNKIKIVFFGTPDFSVESLRAIVDNGYEVAAVVTMPDKIAGRGHHLIQSAVKQFAIERGLKVLQPERLKAEDFVNELKEIGADLFVVIAFRMLPEVVWAMPPLGTFNLHASLLPKYRGAAPINWAIINGETETGVTTFFLQHEIDTGDIIDRVAVEIKPEDNVGDVHDCLMKLGAELTLKTINDIENGTLKTTPQKKLIEEGFETQPAPKIFKETCHVDWNKSAVEIHNLIRGLSPYPCVWSTIHSQTTPPTDIKIFKSVLTETNTELGPGKCIIDNGHLYVECGDRKLLEILEIQPAGKKRMQTEAYLRGARLTDPYFA